MCVYIYIYIYNRPLSCMLGGLCPLQQLSMLTAIPAYRHVCDAGIC